MLAGRYYIANGVRRAVAARESGVSSIRALLRRAGRRDELVVVTLQQLNSPKTAIQASDPRYKRVWQAFSGPKGRQILPPIEIELVGSPAQSRSIPLKDVVLIP